MFESSELKLNLGPVQTPILTCAQPHTHLGRLKELSLAVDR